MANLASESWLVQEILVSKMYGKALGPTQPPIHCLAKWQPLYTLS
jgi:hypothetical protein